ncbi:MAG TPA: citXG protein [Erysipelothrix sp.]|nr:citXG protein [Erysipelothrix sp.]
MNIIPLSSESIEMLRKKRREVIKTLSQDQDGTLLVLGGAFGGSYRKHHAVSYGVISIFFELWDRYIFDSWSYTFDADGLMFYIQIDQDAKGLKNTLIHYEDYHPLGFAVKSYVYKNEGEITRQDLGVKARLDYCTKKPMLEVLDSYNDDEEYLKKFIESVEKYIINSDRNLILSNILLYGFVGAFTKEMGLGVYGPNHSGLDPQMNFEKFIYMLRTFYKNASKIRLTNLNSPRSIVDLQNRIESEIQHSLLSQRSFHYPIYMSTITLMALMKSNGYKDITKQIKQIASDTAFSFESLKKQEVLRYDIAKTGFKLLFNYFIPFYQKNDSIEATLFQILSRYDDQSIVRDSGESNLLKVKFLAKNLMLKEDKWIELHRFCLTNNVEVFDATIVLANTIMLDLIQRNYLKIKMTLEN